MIDMKSIRFPPPAADEMVRATLEGRKTVTRRAVKPQHLRVLDSPYHKEPPETPDKVLLERLCDPPYLPGDILYVRETWAAWSPTYGTAPEIIYKADGYSQSHKMKWRPSIHMPREAARLFLRVTDVRVERVQDITYWDCLSEGITEEDIEERGANAPDASAKWLYAKTWDSTIKPAARDLYGWDANPWVWVIEFERISEEEAYAHEENSEK